MTPIDNKRLMQHVFDHLAQGNARPFADLMASDLRWTVMGQTPWSGTYQGKETVADRLLRPLFAQFADRYRSTAYRIIAEGDWVVVQCRGNATTKRGQRYENEYCYVCRFFGGTLREIIEYGDTELVSAALDPPPAW